MNLLEEPWLPVRRANEARERVCPWQLTDGIDSDSECIVALDVPRADFNASLIQFLIGLFQTVWSPDDDIAWNRAYLNPPDPETLRQACLQYRHAFELDGGGPRFFQDLTLSDGTSNGISALLIEEPGGNTLRENRDLFIKRNQYPSLGITGAIAALITLQTNAPSGGKGHRTSLRGGGPLTTLIVPDSLQEDVPANLWRLVWLNVLSRKAVDSMTGNAELAEDSAIFPWLAPTRTSEANGGTETTPEDAHPLQMYWAMPRRIRLDLENLPTGICPMTLAEEPLVFRYETRSYGVNYEGAWRHPLSPHSRNKDGLMLPLHPQPGGIGYRHWLSLALGDEQGVLPASVVSEAIKSRQRKRRKTRLWAFGYDMDNMKARAWYESVMPLHHLDDEIRPKFVEAVGDLIFIASQISYNLREALKKAWFKPNATVRGDLSFIVNSFWFDTENDFFQTLAELHSLIEKAQSQQELRKQWFHALDRVALDLFDLWAAGGNIENEDPASIATARRTLIRFNRSNKIQKVVQYSQQAA